MRYIKCLLITMILMPLLAESQRFVRRHKTPTSWHEGFIVTNRGDTISGKVKLGAKFVLVIANDMREFIKINQKLKEDGIFISSLQEYLVIKKELAKMVRVKVRTRDHPLGSDDFIDFVMRGSRKKFHRKLLEGKVSVYDFTEYSDEKPGVVNYEGILIVKGDSVSKGPVFRKKRWLIREVNKLFHTNAKVSDFKSKLDVLCWLRDNANESILK